MTQIRFIICILVCSVTILATNIAYAKELSKPQLPNTYLESGNIQTVAIIMAMEAEAQPIIEALDLQYVGPFDRSLPMQRYEGKYGELDVVMVINGIDPRYGVDSIGSQLGATNALMTIQTYQPDLLINAGTAGGFKNKGGEIGDVYYATEFKYHDRRITIPAFVAYGIGSYPAVSSPQIINDLGLKSGVISTGDSFDMTKTDAKMIIANQAVAKEMEAAGVAEIATLYQTPIIALKVIVDIVDSNDEQANTSEQQFEENFNLAIAALQEKLLATLAYLQPSKNKVRNQ